MIKKLAFGTAVLALLFAGVSPASAEHEPGSQAQEQIDLTLAKYPGGKQISATTISWEEGAILLTFPSSSSSRAVGSCATGSYCVFSATNYGGTKLSFTGCSAAGTSYGVSALGSSVRSIANARTSGTVTAFNGGAVVRAVSANTGVTVNSAAVSTLTCTT